MDSMSVVLTQLKSKKSWQDFIESTSIGPLLTKIHFSYEARASKGERARCDGEKGAPAYVPSKGEVYDVSESFPWKDGNHQVLHRDGVGLTDAMEPVPHGLDVLEKAQAIRPLHAKEPRSEHWCSWCAFSSGINLRIQISIHP